MASESEDDHSDTEVPSNTSNPATAAKDKKKKKKKKAADAPAPAPASKTAAASKTANASKNAPAPTKKPNAAIAAIKRMQEEKRAAEEEQRRMEEELERAEEEEKKRLEEDSKKSDEAKRRKREKLKAKKEELKKSGKLLSKSEKERVARDKLKLEQLKMASGEIGISLPAADAEQSKSKKVVYTKKKPGANRGVSATSLTSPSNENVDSTMLASQLNHLSVGQKGKNEGSDDESDGSVPEAWDISSASSDDSSAASDDDTDDTDDDKTDGKDHKLEEKATVKNPMSTPMPPQGIEKPSLAVPLAKPTVVVGQHDSTVSHSDSASSASESDSDSDDDRTNTRAKAAEARKLESRQRREKRKESALANRSKDDLRSPICCVLGHVDTGKTKLLDKIRQTNVQEGEAGGITQQIGATYFPIATIKTKTAALNALHPQEYKLPGLLVIDTPGHASFTNLRTRGSSLCNIAILVVDIMHGLEPQTIESINLLKMRKTPFVVALNKIDRLYNWKACPDMPFEHTFKQQPQSVKDEFEERLNKTKLAFSEQGLNAELCFNNKDVRKYVSLVPTSAITGEGIPDLLMLIVTLTQKMMSEKLMYLSELECTVLEVKVIEGLGTTIDVILSNGVLREGDRIVVCGMNGPIATTVRALLTPQPLREMRVKSNYVHHKEVKAALGVKISAQDLDKAIAGSRLLVVGPEDDEEDMKEEVMSDLEALLGSVDTSGVGVSVQASTLGSLEALLSFLKDSSIPVCSINIGPVHKKDVIKASVMLEHAKEYATMLCFDVKVDKDAQDMADDLGVKVFKAEIIYHLFDQFTAYMNDMNEQKKKDLAPQAVFPCILRVVPNCVFNKRDPIIMGVDVVEGVLRVGTPLIVPSQGMMSLGKVTSIELNHKNIDACRKGMPSVAIKIENASYEPSRMYGRHFTDKDDLVSKISRSSIDILKENFRKDMTADDWNLVKKLKNVFGIL